MTRKVWILKRAERDLEEIFRYLARDRPSVARSVVEDLLAAIESLAEAATRASRPRDERLRRLGYFFLVRGPYLVFFKVARRYVRVYRVLHGKRQYETLL